MATSKQRLALSIINFLNTSLTDGTLTEEDRESVEVAQNCISEIFKVDPGDKTLEDSQTLLQIYSVYEKLRRNQLSDSKNTATTASTTTPTGSSSSTTTKTDANNTTVVSDEKKKQAEEFKSQGNAFMVKKDYSTAIELYTKALEIIPENPIFLSNRAAAYSASRDYKSACADAEAAVAIDPTYTKAWSRLGLARFALGDPKGSKEAYAKGIEYEGNGGSDAMKKGFETASKRVAEEESSEDRDRSSSKINNDTSGTGSGGMPDLSALAGMFGGGGAGGAGGGLPDLSSIMSNPMFANMAKNLMSNPGALNSLMNNPRVADLVSQFGGSGSGGGRGAGGGMPDLSSLMQDPSIADMASKFLGGAGRGNGQ